MTAIGLALIGVGALLVWSAFQDYEGSPHAGGPGAVVSRAFTGTAATPLENPAASRGNAGTPYNTGLR